MKLAPGGLLIECVHVCGTFDAAAHISAHILPEISDSNTWDVANRYNLSSATYSENRIGYLRNRLFKPCTLQTVEAILMENGSSLGSTSIEMTAAKSVRCQFAHFIPLCRKRELISNLHCIPN